MNILWIGKKPFNAFESGEEIYDRKMIAACRALGHTVDLFHPQAVSRINEVRNMMLGVPYQRARFATSSNLRELRAKAADYDLAVCSWEPFDGLARSLPIPTILIVHNISSTALPELFPGKSLARLAAVRAGIWERGAYRSRHYAAIGALSKNDLAYLRSINAPNPIWLPPGMPPCATLRDDAVLRPDIVVSGTYSWAPKRRDVLQFAAEYSKHPITYPVYADSLPALANDQLKPKPITFDASDAIRFGVITDRFESGHKLKTLAYIALNQIVLSFANVAFDFAHIPDHELFIVRVATIEDMQRRISDFMGMPSAELHNRFVKFKATCADNFSWSIAATALIDASKHLTIHRKVA